MSSSSFGPPRPAGFPVELRVGSTGAGIFIGCGAGLGIVTPINLHAVPVLGQLVSSLSTSLGSLNHATGGLATATRSRVRALGVRNLDLGFGCGVILGYGYGAGIMVKPTALQSLTQTLQAAGQRLTAKLPQPLQQALLQQQQQRGLAVPQAGLSSSSSSAGVSGALPDSWQDPARSEQQLQQQPGGHQTGGTATAPSPGMQPGSRQQHREQTDAELAELAKLVLKQQNQLSDLQQQVATLQVAVCKLDRSAPGCSKHT